MFYSVGIFRTSGPGGSLSSSLERAAPRRWGEEPGYIEVLQQRVNSLNIRRLLLIKENQISQVKEFSSFPCMVRCKSLGSLKIIPSICISAIWSQYPVFSHLSSLGAHHREWLQSNGCQITGMLLLRVALEGSKCWWLWHRCLLIW